MRADDAKSDYRNGANTYGWVVEIDPFTPGSTPKKRTALGRMGHEGAALGPVVAGKPLVWYMGDDARNDYFYKFVSAKNWDPADATVLRPMVLEAASTYATEKGVQRRTAEQCAQ